MFRWISILGGLLIMMGQHDRSEALFHYFRYSEMDRPSTIPNCCYAFC
jgi:hypothetical protein